MTKRSLALLLLNLKSSFLSKPSATNFVSPSGVFIRVKISHLPIHSIQFNYIMSSHIKRHLWTLSKNFHIHYKKQLIQFISLRKPADCGESSLCYSLTSPFSISCFTNPKIRQSKATIWQQFFFSILASE